LCFNNNFTAVTISFSEYFLFFFPGVSLSFLFLFFDVDCGDGGGCEFDICVDAVPSRFDVNNGGVVVFTTCVRIGDDEFIFRTLFFFNKNKQASKQANKQTKQTTKKQKKEQKIMFIPPPPPPPHHQIYNDVLSYDILISILHDHISKTQERIVSSLSMCTNTNVLRILSLPPPLLPTIPTANHKVRKKIRKSKFAGVGIGKTNRMSRKRQNISYYFINVIKKNERVFQSYTGVDQLMFKDVLRNAERQYVHTRGKFTLEFILLVTMVTLRRNSSCSDALIFFNLPPTTFSRLFKKGVSILCSTLKDSVSLSNLSFDIPHPLFYSVGIVDHSHLRTPKKNLYQNFNYRRDRKHGIIFQIICNRIGSVCHFYGSVQGSTNDQLVHRLSSVQNSLKGLTILADGGFRSSNTFPHLCVPGDSEQYGAQHASERIVVECFLVS